MRSSGAKSFEEIVSNEEVEVTFDVTEGKPSEETISKEEVEVRLCSGNSFEEIVSNDGVEVTAVASFAVVDRKPSEETISNEEVEVRLCSGKSFEEIVSNEEIEVTFDEKPSEETISNEEVEVRPCRNATVDVGDTKSLEEIVSNERGDVADGKPSEEKIRVEVALSPTVDVGIETLSPIATLEDETSTSILDDADKTPVSIDAELAITIAVDALAVILPAELLIISNSGDGFMVKTFSTSIELTIEGFSEKNSDARSERDGNIGVGTRAVVDVAAVIEGTRNDGTGNEFETTPLEERN